MHVVLSLAHKEISSTNTLCLLGLLHHNQVVAQHTLPLSAFHSRTLILRPFDTLSIYVAQQSPSQYALSPSLQLGEMSPHNVFHAATSIL